MAAFSLIELLFALGVAATLAVTGVTQVSSALDGVRAAGAARYVAARLQQVRIRAVTRGRDTALRISRDSAGYLLAVYEDGNRNGVLSRDIEAGVDTPVGHQERLASHFPGVEFGSLPAVPGVAGGAAPGADPIRLGAADSVTFTAMGTATPGSLYLRAAGSQFVVRIYGDTGRTRILKYNVSDRSWSAP